MLDTALQIVSDGPAALSAHPPLAAALMTATLFGARHQLRRLAVRAIFRLAMIPRHGHDTVVEARRAIVHIRPHLGGWIVLAYAKPDSAALVRRTEGGRVAPVPAAAIDRLQPAYAGFFLARGDVARATRAIARIFS